MTKRQKRITNGCNLIINEIAVNERWGSKLSTNLLKRLQDLISQELNEEPEDLYTQAKEIFKV